MAERGLVHFLLCLGMTINSAWKKEDYGTNYGSSNACSFAIGGNSIVNGFNGGCSRNKGYQSLGTNVSQGFRPIQEIRAYFDNVVSESTNGIGFWDFRKDWSIMGFSTTQNSVEKFGNVTYLTNDPMPSDSCLMED